MNEFWYFCYKLATRVFSTTSSVYKIYKLIAAANNISKLKYSKHKLEWILLCKKSRGRSFKQFRWLENFISSSTQKEHCVHHKYCKTNAQHWALSICFTNGINTLGYFLCPNIREWIFGCTNIIKHLCYLLTRLH